MSIDPIRGGATPIQTAVTGGRPAPDTTRKSETPQKDDVKISREALSLAEADSKAKEISQFLAREKDVTLTRPGALDESV